MGGRGSSSHAPGLVFQANGSKTMTELATYTVDKLGSLEVDGRACFLPVGGLEVATTPDRLRDLHRRLGWLTSWGVEAAVVSAKRCAELFPMLDADRVLAGLHTPTDGIAKAVLAIETQGRRAVERGARFIGECEVTGVVTADGAVSGVTTS